MAASLFFELQIGSFINSICNNIFQAISILFRSSLILICVQHNKTHPPIAPNEMALFFIIPKYIKSYTASKGINNQHVKWLQFDEESIFYQIPIKLKYSLKHY